MEYTTLGKTGLKVSVAGLGCGGFSRVGRGTGRTQEESVALIRRSLDLGVNFIDTAAAYGTEDIIGEVIHQVGRDGLVISSKAGICDLDGVRYGVSNVVASLERSLETLGIDTIDIFHLHGVPPAQYDYAVEEIVPALLKERDKGKLSCLGITEVPPYDPEHELLRRVQSKRGEVFEVVMVAYHMMNQSARRLVFPHTLNNGVGVLVMFAVRLLFSEPGRLAREVNRLIDEGQLPPELRGDNPLGFLVEGGARSLIDAAYRYCRHTDGTDVVLFGTGNVDHMEANIESINGPPLPDDHVARLEELFSRLSGIGLDFAKGNNP